MKECSLSEDDIFELVDLGSVCACVYSFGFVNMFVVLKWSLSSFLRSAAFW